MVPIDPQYRGGRAVNMSKLPELSSPGAVGAQPSLTTSMGEQSSMGLSTFVAPLQDAVADALFGGGPSLASASLDTTPATTPAADMPHADKLLRAATHRAKVLQRRRREARAYNLRKAEAARGRREAFEKDYEERVLQKVRFKAEKPRILRELALQRLRRALLLTIMTQATRATILERKLELGRKNIAVRRKRQACALVVQRAFRLRRTQHMWTQFSKYVRLMKRQRIRLVVHLRCWRRAYAAEVVRDFLRVTANSSRLQRIVLTFTERVMLGQSLARKWFAARKARIEVLNRIYVEAEALQMEEERKATLARLDRIRTLLRQRLEKKSMSKKPTLSMKPTRDRSLAEKIKDAVDKCEASLRFQRNKVTNLIEGHQERYELCCANRLETTELMADYDRFLSGEAAPGSPQQRPTTAPAVFSREEPALRKPSVKEIIRDSRASRAGRVKQEVGVKINRAELSAPPPPPPRCAAKRRKELLAALLARRLQAWRRRIERRASRASHTDEPNFHAPRRLSLVEAQEVADDAALSGGDGSFTPADAMRWLRLQDEKPHFRPEQADASAMLEAATQGTYMFYNSFGGARGMWVAVDDCVRGERLRQRALQEEMEGTLEAKFGLDSSVFVTVVETDKRQTPMLKRMDSQHRLGSKGRLF